MSVPYTKVHRLISYSSFYHYFLGFRRSSDFENSSRKKTNFCTAAHQPASLSIPLSASSLATNYSRLMVGQLCSSTVIGLFYTLPSIPSLTSWFVLILHSSHKVLCESHVAKKVCLITRIYQIKNLTSCQNKTYL